MTEPEQLDPGYNPGESFNDGFEAAYDIASQETQEQLENLGEQLINDGYDPDEVNELLYDPAPRKGGRRKKAPSRRGRKSRRYDPAPRRGRGSRRRYDPEYYVRAKKRAKGLLPKLRKLAIPGAAGMTFYAAYVKRATDLKASGKIPENNVFKAIQYDIENFNATDAVARMQTAAPSILTPVIGGWAIKKSGILGKYSGIAGDILTGMGLGVAGKAILDPPISASQSANRNKGHVVKATCEQGTDPRDQRNAMQEQYVPWGN
ncbi:MAG: hypothetical protein L6282_01925 [Candidatus Methanoperedenaceae archaeon]|nr:hypothetical protein [Candidatus Methanoperedenaceae archaeon]